MVQCDYKSIQKLAGFIIYVTLVVYSFLKFQLHLEGTQTYDLVISIFIGVMMKVAYGLKTDLNDIKSKLSPENQREFERFFALTQVPFVSTPREPIEAEDGELTARDVEVGGQLYSIQLPRRPTVAPF